VGAVVPPKDKDDQVHTDDQKYGNSDHGQGRAAPLRTAGVAAALAVIALLAAGCGASGPQGGAGPGQNLAAELDAFATCVRSHGVPGFYFTTSTPSPPPYGAVIGFHGYNAAYDSTPAFDAAEKACQHLDPMGTPARVTHQQFLKALRSAECMRSHGYSEWPDPSPNQRGFRVPVSIDTSSPQFGATAKACGLPPGV
jgi:hypothetical protein